MHDGIMKNVLITGASRGLGIEMVWQLLQEEDGPTVIATCREPAKANALARMKSQHPDRLKVFALDVSDPSSVETARDAVFAHIGHLDWLVNNAGVGGFESFYEVDLDKMVEVFRTNAVAPLLVTRTFLPLLEKSEAAMVFLVSSKMGSLTFMQGGGFEAIPYPASKAALNMVGVQLANFLCEKRIGVILQTPGWVKTEMGGDEAPLTPNQSVSKVIEVWRGLCFEDSGTFFDEDGRRVDW